MKVLRSILAWTTLAVMGALGLLAMLVVPGLERRRRIARFTARAVLAAAGIRLEVVIADGAAGQELPRSCVVIANHTSYLDGVILTAVLPPRFGFVVKKEMSRVPLAGQLLRRIGSEFVDRADRHRGAMDARRVLRRASAGQALVFFPEGTFSKQPGLLRFHTGAFVTAVRAKCPVVPLVIHGAQQALRHDRLLITPGTIRIEVLKPLMPAMNDRQAAITLRDEARRQIAERLGEDSHIAPVLPPDLVERM